MSTFQESCPLYLTDKVITFTIEDGREPVVTQGCICGGTDQERALRLAAGTATAANLGKALGDSMLPEKKEEKPGQPVEYTAFEVKGAHSSVIIKVGE
ncbi:MAG: hypothetical protein AAB580_00325 [Patescibacteria group bacterium]